MKVEVTLPKPLKVDGQEVKIITFVREPIGQDFGQFGVLDVLDGKIGALSRVIPKICPQLSSEQIRHMPQANITALTEGLSVFLEPLDGNPRPKVIEEKTKPKATASGKS